MPDRNKKIRVICAMSGGVDSSVAAALLKKAGFEVVGVFMKLLDTGKENEARARQTAKRLDVPFKVLDLRQDFKKLVVDKFIADSKKGMTPNPCAVCNREIKFGLLIDNALEMGADYVATGHYAQIKKTKDGIYHLLKGADNNKDQSYFLWRLNQKQLSRVIFPVGCFEKDQVRQLAKKWKLPTAKTPESQEACFINGDMAGFLEKHCETKPGNIIDASGKIIGRHRGRWFYTIGQRKGISLSGGPFYVIAKDRAKNELVVSRQKKDLVSKSVRFGNVLWVAGKKPELPLRIEAKIRYRARAGRAILSESGRGYELCFVRPQSAITPGQSAVFYQGKELIGGGSIK